MTTEIRFSGFGGQGIIRCALIAGKALSLFGGKHASMNQSFGPEARGSACSSQLLVSEERILYPYLTRPEILISMSQDAYDKYEPELRDGGTLIIDEDLVRPRPVRAGIKFYSVPSTRFAEELGNRITANLVMMGFFTAVTGITTPEVMKKALPGLVPERSLELNNKAFDKGYEHGQRILAAGPQPAAAAPETAATKTAPAKAREGEKKRA
jgi:2-oxoglutarate ferredoxin oxidoreductase subunit gamma